MSHAISSQVYKVTCDIQKRQVFIKAVITTLVKGNVIAYSVSGIMCLQHTCVTRSA